MLLLNADQKLLTKTNIKTNQSDDPTKLHNSLLFAALFALLVEKESDTHVYGIVNSLPKVF